MCMELLNDVIVQCEECGNNIKYRISGYEYSVGCFNYEDNEIHGRQFLEKPNMGIVYQLTPGEFEEVVEEVFKRQGFQTRLTPQTRDGRKDIIATKSILGRPVMFLIECKRYNEMNKIGVDIVRALYGVQTAERANKAIIVTSSYFTEDAQRFVEQQKTMIDLFDIDDLIRLMENSIQDEQGNF